MSSLRKVAFICKISYSITAVNDCIILYLSINFLHVMRYLKALLVSESIIITILNHIYILGVSCHIVINFILRLAVINRCKELHKYRVPNASFWLHNSLYACYLLPEIIISPPSELINELTVPDYFDYLNLARFLLKSKHCSVLVIDRLLVIDLVIGSLQLQQLLIEVGRGPSLKRLLLELGTHIQVDRALVVKLHFTGFVIHRGRHWVSGAAKSN